MPQIQAALRQLWPASAANRSVASPNKHTLIIGLMVPFVMLTLNMAVFGVTLPAIRDAFQLQAGLVAWLVTAYTLPFMIATPLYGRLGDELGKRRVFIAGIITFLAGTLITLSATTLSWLMLGRAIQGLGSAGVVPLCIAVISQRFPAGERGKAMGSWNSIGPVANMVGPLLAGFLVDYIHWRLVFGPVLLVSLAALWAVWKQVPPKQGNVTPGVLWRFDWGGLILLAAAVTAMLFYLSSQQLTGVAALRDWRLLSLTLCLFSSFIIWEKRQANPFITLQIFANPTFSRASTIAGIRMFAMSGIDFLIPLYLADVHHLNAAFTGFMLMTHAVALLVTMRLGGQLADRWNSRWPVMTGLTVQVGVMAGFALMPGVISLWLVAGGLVLHGLSAGLSLAALHRASLGKVSLDQAGTAAGLYSMVRFVGSMLGPALAGLILQWGLDQSLLPLEAYRLVFWLIAGLALLGVALGWGLRE